MSINDRFIGLKASNDKKIRINKQIKKENKESKINREALM